MMVEARWNGSVIASSENTVVLEGNHYFPADAIDAAVLRPSSTTTVCPWKGTARYYSLNVEGAENHDAAWYYPDPNHPRERIIDRGGAILFVEVPGVGIVGTCALQRTGEHQYELTKMGVLLTARGTGAGGVLLDAVIDRAQKMGAERLYLLSNRKSAAGIHLYEKHGFVHDEEIMAEFGARYVRCDVAMSWRGDRVTSP